MILALMFVFVFQARVCASEPASLLEAGDTALRDDLRWLNDRGVIHLSTSSWPLSYQAVRTAIINAHTTTKDPYDIRLLKTLQKKLELPYSAPVSGRLSAGYTSQAMPLGGFTQEQQQESHQRLSLTSAGESVVGTLALNHLTNPVTDKQSSGNLAGSYLATSFAGQIIYGGQLNHWWGPGTDGSLQWSNAATPLWGVGLRRASEQAPDNRFLSLIGPWSYELFLGQLSHDTSAPGVRMFGARVQIRPLKDLEIGVSRMFEWGGRGANDQLADFANSLIGNGNSDANGGAVSNEVAGVDVQYTTRIGGNPLTFYGQVIGEDEAGKLPYRLSSLIGGRYQARIAGVRLVSVVEAADTQSDRWFGLHEGTSRVTYRHDTFYRDGFYHDGMPIGYFSGGDSTSTAISLVCIPKEDADANRYRLRYVNASLNRSGQVINQENPQSDQVSQIEFGVASQSEWMSFPVEWSIGVQARHSQVHGNDVASTVQIAVSF